MDDATQSATQPYTDPRRRGLTNSGFGEEDVSDIICILHPTSIAAHTAVALTARRCSQHILQVDNTLEYDMNDGTYEQTNLDLALRFSSSVKDLTAGFAFGRNPHRSDIVLCPDDDGQKKISNTHFRIYFKPDGILMLEDTSTNGTIVDNIHIRKDKRNGAPKTRMLVHGSIIHVVSNESSTGIKFIVRIPSRDDNEQQFHDNLVNHLKKIRRDGEQRRDANEPIISHQIGSSCGMRWNGGPKYNVTKQIGKGAFATVYKLATKDDGTPFACKELDKRRLMKNQVLDHRVDSEMRIMKDLVHPNIVRFHDYHDHENRWLYIIMEFVEHGELSSYLSNPDGLPEDSVQTIAKQVLHALRYLHSRKITHRDIKPDNILISSLAPLQVKLSDFGLSKVVQEETFMKTFCGTLLYCAPEVYPEYDEYVRLETRKRRRVGNSLPRTSPYDQSVDMWSFGAVLFHILCGVPPYIGRPDDRGAHMLRNIMTSEPDYDILRKVNVSEDAIDFISKLLNRNPKARPKESACLKHPWLANVPDEFEYMEIHEPEDEEVNADLKAIAEVSEPDSSEYEPPDPSGIDLNDMTHDPFAEESDSFDHTTVKRPRVAEDQGMKDLAAEIFPDQVPYPSLPNISSYDFGSSVQFESATPTTRRLFGEIDKAALRSSGTLAPGVQIPMEGPQFQRQFDEVSGSDHASSNGKSSSHGLSLHTAIPSKYLLSEMASRLRRSPSSLMGAESLVENFNISFDGTSTSINSQSPGVRDGDNHESLPDGYNNRGEEADADMEDLNFLEGEQVTRRSRIHPIFTPKQNRPNEFTVPDSSSSHNSREDSPFEDKESDLSWVDLACTIDAQTGNEIQQSGDNSDDEMQNTPVIARSSQPKNKALIEKTNTINTVHPPSILGKLTPTPGSITATPIILNSRMTSWGRGTCNSIRYHNPMDPRIPTYALEVTFWAPSIEGRIEAGEDWREMMDVMTVVSTKASNCIWVNDVELRKENQIGDSYLFGKVYTGDIITIYRSREEFLQYRCEFFHGGSARFRPADEQKFLIQMTRKIRRDSSKSIPSVTVSTVTGEQTENEL